MMTTRRCLFLQGVTGGISDACKRQVNKYACSELIESLIRNEAFCKHGGQCEGI